MKQKLDEAKRLRKLSKKNQKLKFRQEVDTVKRNMERRDEIWKKQQLADIWRYNMHQQNYLKQEKDKELNTKKDGQIKAIKDKHKKIKKLTQLEQDLLDRLQNTIDLE